MEIEKRIEEIGVNLLAESVNSFKERIRNDINELNEEKRELTSILGKRKREENESITPEENQKRKRLKVDKKSDSLSKQKTVRKSSYKVRHKMKDEDEEETNEEEDEEKFVTPPVFNKKIRKRQGGIGHPSDRESQTSLELVSPSKAKQIQSAIDFQHANEEFERKERDEVILSTYNSVNMPERTIGLINRQSPLEIHSVKELNDECWKPISGDEFIIMVKFSPVELVMAVLTNLRILLVRMEGIDWIIINSIVYDKSGKSKVDGLKFTPDGRYVLIFGNLLVSCDDDPYESQDVFLEYSYSCRLYPVFEEEEEEDQNEDDEDDDDDDEEEEEEEEEEEKKEVYSSSSDNSSDIFEKIRSGGKRKKKRRKKKTKKKKKKSSSSSSNMKKKNSKAKEEEKKKNKEEMMKKRIVDLKETDENSRIIDAIFSDDQVKKGGLEGERRRNMKLVVVTEREIMRYILSCGNWDYEDHRLLSRDSGVKIEDDDEDDDDDDADTQIDIEEVKKKRRRYVCANILVRDRTPNLLMVATNVNTIEFWEIERGSFVKTYNVPSELCIQITKLRPFHLDTTGLVVTIGYDPIDPSSMLIGSVKKELEEEDGARSLEILREGDDEEDEEENVNKKKKKKSGFGVIHIRNEGVVMLVKGYDKGGDYEFTSCDWLGKRTDFSYIIIGTKDQEILIYKVMSGQIMGKMGYFGFSEKENSVVSKRDPKKDFDDDDDILEEEEDVFGEVDRRRFGINSIEKHLRYPMIAFSIGRGVSIFFQRNQDDAM